MTTTTSKVSTIFSNSPLIIAEVSGNHDGDIEKCKELILQSKFSGAHVAKLQAFTANKITIKTNKKDFLIPSDSPWSSFSNLATLYEKAQTPLIWFETLYAFARQNNFELISSVFDEESFEILESVNNQIYKIASPEINHLPLIKKIARKNRPIILSLGVASQYDFESAISTFRKISDAPIIVLQCDTAYPAMVTNANLILIKELMAKYPFRVGYSDHTRSSLSALVALGIGADVFEKHIKLENDEDSVDSFFSLNPSQFSTYTKDLNEGYLSLGKNVFRRSDESTSISIYPFKEIRKGQQFTTENIQICRPGKSLHPKYWYKILGLKAIRDYEIGDRIFYEDLRFE